MIITEKTKRASGVLNYNTGTFHNYFSPFLLSKQMGNDNDDKGLSNPDNDNPTLSKCRLLSNGLQGSRVNYMV